jgi:hypothetical protein
MKVKSNEGNAKWDSAAATLSITVPVIRDDF